MHSSVDSQFRLLYIVNTLNYRTVVLFRAGESSRAWTLSRAATRAAELYKRKYGVAL